MHSVYSQSLFKNLGVSATPLVSSFSEVDSCGTLPIGMSFSTVNWLLCQLRNSKSSADGASVHFPSRTPMIGAIGSEIILFTNFLDGIFGLGERC